MEKNEAYYSGTGLIETMRLTRHKIPLLHHHFERLEQGLMLLSAGSYPGRELLTRLIAQCLASEGSPGEGIVRLQSGFLTTRQQTGFSVEYRPLTAWPPEGLTVGIARDIIMPQDSLSQLKTNSRLRYVMALQQAKNEGWDEALMINQAGRISESTFANIFWIEDNTLYTPPLSEGCVHGIMRNQILRHHSLPYTAEEKSLEPDRLPGLEEVFLTNAVRGIIPLARIQDRRYATRKTEQLKKAIEPFIFQTGDNSRKPVY